MNDIRFEDYSGEVKQHLREQLIKGLHESSGEVRDQTKRNSRVDTGKLKRSWKYVINESKLESKIGSEEQNAIWEEYGTGEYATNGNGRKGGWFYVDAKGKGHFTHGKRPNKTLQNAIRTKKSTVKRIMERCLKD